MNTLLKITGLGGLISFYRYIYFNGPRTIQLSGIGLLMLIGLIHLYGLPEHYEAARYLGVSFGALFAGMLLSVYGILLGRGWGWTLGAVISGAAFAAYIVSRARGLPGFEEGVGRWGPLGTATLGLEALYVGLWFSIITGMNVAAPDERRWHD
jgi:hypothetical protein